MCKLSNDEFTFVILNGGVPEVIINGKKLSVVSCSYDWVTSTFNHVNDPTVIVSGYFSGDGTLKVFKLKLGSKQLFEIN